MHTSQLSTLLVLFGTETTMFTLSCDGTMTNLVWHSDNKPEPVTKMELVVNLTEHTVTGFAFPARIYKPARDGAAH